MKRWAVILSGVLAVIAVGGYTASLVTNYWTIKSQGSIEINIGLFDRNCPDKICTQTGILKYDGISWKVASAAMIGSGLLCFFASIVLFVSYCGEKSVAAKASGILLLFPVVFTIAGIVVYVYFELQQADNEDKVTTTFGYSLYTSCGAGAASFLASMIAFAGS